MSPDTLRPRLDVSSRLAWLQADPRRPLAAAAILQIAIVLGLYASSGLTLLRASDRFGGTTVLLSVRPVDPRDPFRGQYVALDYDVAHDFAMANIANAGATCYVPLEVAPNGYARAAPEGWQTEPPRSGPFIRGRVGRIPGRLEFGIESFYCQEDRAPAYEQAVRSGTLFARVALTADGQPTLLDLVDINHLPPGDREPRPNPR
jgi:uncharacterized membrane-anchored protein